LTVKRLNALKLISSPDDQYGTIGVTHYPVNNATKYRVPNTGIATLNSAAYNVHIQKWTLRIRDFRMAISAKER
jgi:hypothetical protein